MPVFEEEPVQVRHPRGTSVPAVMVAATFQRVYDERFQAKYGYWRLIIERSMPDKGEHLVRYYSWYSHRQRGMRAKSDPEAVSEGDSNAEEIKIDCSAVNAQ